MGEYPDLFQKPWLSVWPPVLLQPCTAEVTSRLPGTVHLGGNCLLVFSRLEEARDFPLVKAYV